MTAPRSRYPRKDGGGVEVYERLRFFTQTGVHVAGTPLEIEDRQAEFEALIVDLDAQLAAGKTKAKAKAKPARKPKGKATLSDAAVLERLRRKEKYARLLAGDFSDYGDDHSTVDLVVCGAIAREVGPDAERIDRVFRTTVLMRAKWDEAHRADGATYGEMVVEKVLEGLEEAPSGGGQKDLLLAQAAELRFFHTPDGDGFAAVPRDDHDELLPIMGKTFGRWLRQDFWESEGKGASATVVRDALLTLDARANFEGEEREIGVRIVGDEEAIHVDLANAAWEAVRITAAGWEIVASPLLFRRGRGMKPLPTPERGGSLELLRPLLNVETEDDFILIVAWLLGALRPHGPYPVLSLGGEHGASKSQTSRLQRGLIDPASPSLKSMPGNDRELMIAAQSNWVLAYDNLSGLSPAMSDALCRLATGGGLSCRELFTNSEEVIFDATRPIILNGIDDLTGRADLLSRSLVITLPPIEAEKRLTEREIGAAVAKVRPRILGALYDAVACALRRLPEVRLASPPRMADFAAWVVAAEPALPWEAGRFLAAYGASQRAMGELALDMDRVGEAIIEMMSHVSVWTGTASDMLKALRDRDLADLRGNDIPSTPRGVSNRLHRLAPLLRTRGLEVEFRKSTERKIIITNASGPPDRAIYEGASVRVRGVKKS
jgi:hypothetical protein